MDRHRPGDIGAGAPPPESVVVPAAVAAGLVLAAGVRAAPVGLLVLGGGVGAMAAARATNAPRWWAGGALGVACAGAYVSLVELRRIDWSPAVLFVMVVVLVLLVAGGRLWRRLVSVTASLMLLAVTNPAGLVTNLLYGLGLDRSTLVAYVSWLGFALSSVSLLASLLVLWCVGERWPSA